MSDQDKQAAIDAILEDLDFDSVKELRAYVSKNEQDDYFYGGILYAINAVQDLSFAQPKIIHCKDCKHWRQNTNYQGVPLSFGFCESDDMWRSLYGETYEVSHIDTDDDFYCGYAERRTNG